MDMYYMTSHLGLIIVPIILVLLAQFLVTSNYKKYAKIRNNRNMTGYEVARRILDSNGLQEVQVVQGQGQLSDHFDPTQNVIRLSPDVYGQPSISSLAIAAHEVGHAIQYATKYPVIGFRNRVLPLAITAGNMAWIVIMIGLFTSGTSFLWFGIGLLLVIGVFQLVTLPLEFNASSRALNILETGGYLDYDEIPKAKRVLSAAALTYVVALITTLAEVLRLILIAQARD